MKRHPSLVSLSRDHHHALVLARAARGRDGPPSGEAGTGDPASLVARVVAQFQDELEPHFAIEERELIPRSESRGEPLASQAAHVVADHTALRAMITALASPASLPDPLADRLAQLDAFGARLEEHVRYEERTWFPTLEAELGSEALARLTSSLRAAPVSQIRSFHEDDEGHFVAELACGHTQHVRHRPPWERREWVTTEQGRREHIGAKLTCPMCRMPKLPPDVTEYKRTAEFDAQTVPKGLRQSHRLKAGAWGEIVVTAGRVLYVLEDEGDWGVVLRPDLSGVVGPERPHHVEPEEGARFYVRFLR